MSLEMEINENLVYEKYDLNKTDLESIYIVLLFILLQE